MAIPRRLWDSCVILGYLSGQKDIKTDCEQIIQQCERGELEIATSTLAQAEVAYIQGLSPQESEALILDFFSRKYVIPIAFDIAVARTARRLIRAYKNHKLKPADAVHIATAIQWNLPIIETMDPGLLALSKKEGNPSLIIRRPRYEGPAKLLGL